MAKKKKSKNNDSTPPTARGKRWAIGDQELFDHAVAFADAGETVVDAAADFGVTVQTYRNNLFNACQALGEPIPDLPQGKRGGRGRRNRSKIGADAKTGYLRAALPDYILRELGAEPDMYIHWEVADGALAGTVEAAD